MTELGIFAKFGLKTIRLDAITAVCELSQGTSTVYLTSGHIISVGMSQVEVFRIMRQTLSNAAPDDKMRHALSVSDLDAGVELMRIDTLRELLTHPHAATLTDWEVVEIAADELRKAQGKR